MAGTRLVVFKFLFLFMCVLVFFLLVFSFLRKLSIISLVIYILIEACPFKKYLSGGKFLSTKKMFTDQVVGISL